MMIDRQVDRIARVNKGLGWVDVWGLLYLRFLYTESTVQLPDTASEKRRRKKKQKGKRQKKKKHALDCTNKYVRRQSSFLAKERTNPKTKKKIDNEAKPKQAKASDCQHTHTHTSPVVGVSFSRSGRPNLSVILVIFEVLPPRFAPRAHRF